MIKKTKSASWKRIMALAIIPVFGLLLWASAEPNYIMEYSIDSVVEDTIPEIVTYSSFEIIDSGTTSDNESTYHFFIGDNLDSLENNMEMVSRGGVLINKRAVSISIDDEITESDFIKLKGDSVNPVYVTVGKSTGENVSLHVRGISKDAKPLYIIDGEKVSDIDKINPSDIDNISVLKDASATEIYGDEGKNGVIIIETKNSKTDNSGQNKNTQNKITVTTIKQDTIDPKKSEFWVRGVSKNIEDNSSQRKITVTTIKKDTIVPKKGKSKSEFWIRGISKTAGDKQPLIIIDGEKGSDIEELNPEQIESFSILKDASAIQLYGDEGKNGVVLIVTKKGAEATNNGTQEPMIIKSNQLTITTYPDSLKGKPVFITRGLSGLKGKPLIMVDNKKVSNVEDIDINQVESFTILKDASATAQYGDEGKDGVVLITTKSKKK